MNQITRRALALAAAAWAVPAAAQAPRAEGPRTHAARPTAAAITPEDLRTHLYTLAADSMMGRQVGTRGHVMGTDYIAAQAAALGLQPAGENGTFFQLVPMLERGPEPGGTLSVGMQALAVGTDFVPVPNLGNFLRFKESFSANGAAVVYGGTVGDPAGMISPEQARGRVVVFSAPEPAAGRPPFAFWAGGVSFERYADAALLVFATLDVTPAQYLAYFQGTHTELPSAEQAGQVAVPAAVVATRAAAERMLGGTAAGRAVGAAGGTVSGAFAFYSRGPAFPARNVIGIVPGTDATLRSEYVAIGSHSDHVGTGPAVDHDSLLVFNRILRPEGADQEPDSVTPEKAAELRTQLAARRAAGPARLDSIFNGADDDASGSAGMLEMAQYLLANRPRRSVIFVWHTAEEVGLFGSEWFTDHPTVPREQIVAQLNMDMIGRGGAGDVANGGGPAYLELVGSRRLSTELGDLIEEVNRTGNFGFRFDYGMDAPNHPQQIYCRSDHASYARYGIPVTFFTTGGHSDYHQLTDEPQYIDYDKLANVSRLIAAVAQTVGNRDARPVVDKPVTGPDQPCRQ